MNHERINFAVGSVFASLLVIVATGLIGSAIFSQGGSGEGPKSAVTMASGSGAAATKGKPIKDIAKAGGNNTKAMAKADGKDAPASGGGNDLAALLAKADVARGKKIAKKCVACHTFNSGGKNRVGPNLWNIVGANLAHVADFKYSNAMKTRGGTWSYEFLDCFLKKPKSCIKGTKMGYSGLKKAAQRADLIAYLRSLSNAPIPLPGS